MPFEVIQGFNMSKNAPLDETRIVPVNEDAMLAIKWVYKGLIVARIDTSPIELWICKVIKATQPGAPNYTDMIDWEEFIGTDGADGADGSQIHTGTGVPSDVLGENGDFYLDNATGNYYTKAAGAWGAAQGNLIGPAGADGADGIDGAGAPVYGEIYTHEGVGTQVVATGVPEILTQFTDNDIASSGVTPDQANNKIILTEAGIYKVTVDLSFSGSNSSSWLVSAYANVDAAGAAEIDGGHIARKLGTGGDVGAVSFSTLYEVGEGETVDIEVWIESDGNNNFVLEYGTLDIISLGAKGDDGADGGEGKALIHTEFDITLTAAKITNVEGGAPHTATIYNPYSASIRLDDRSTVEKNSTAGIIGTMTANSISYDGIAWYNNGRWLGHDGAPGVQGEAGEDSIVPGPPGADGAGVLVVDAKWKPFNDLNFEIVNPFDHAPSDIYNKRIRLDTSISTVGTFNVEFPNSVAQLQSLRKVTLIIFNDVSNINIQCTTLGGGDFFNSFSGGSGTTLLLNPFMQGDLGAFTFIPSIIDGVCHWHVVGGVQEAAAYSAAEFKVWSSIVDDDEFYTNSSNIYSVYHNPTQSGRHLIDIAAQHYITAGQVNLYYTVHFQTWDITKTTLITTTTYDLVTPIVNQAGSYRIHTSIVASLDPSKSYRVWLRVRRGVGSTQAHSRFLGSDTFGVTYIK